MNLSIALQRAASLLQNGQMMPAAQLCHEVLRNHPENVDALNILSMIAYMQGDFQKAVKFGRKAVSVMPDNLQLLNNLANALKASGELEDALTHYRKCVELDRSCFPPLFNIGNVLSELNRPAEAIAAYERAAKLNPRYPAIDCSVGNELRKLGRSSESIVYFERAIKAKPDYYEAYVQLGNCHSEAERFGEAVQYYKKAVSIDSGAYEAYVNLACALNNDGRIDEAEAAIQQAFRIKPDSPVVATTLGTIQCSRGNYPSAAATLEGVIKRWPEMKDAYLHLGYSYTALGNRLQAAETLNNGIQRFPSDESLLVAAGTALSAVTRQDEGLAAFDRALGMNPRSIAAQWGRALAHLQEYYETEEEMNSALAVFSESVANLDQWLDFDSPGSVRDAETALQNMSLFNILLHEGSHRDTLSSLGRFAAKVMTARYPDMAEPNTVSKPSEGEKIRVGIVSPHFYKHSVWRMVTNGWLSHFSRDRFEIFGYSLGAWRDELTSEIAGRCNRFVEIRDIGRLGETLKQDRLHVLFYPALGADPISYLLAATRLAPIQCTSDGQPITSGLSTIDYYFAPAAALAEDAEEQYTEKLVPLSGVGSHVELEIEGDKIPDLSKYGIERGGINYLCVQALHKYLPQFDEIYPRIAARVPHSRFIFVSRGDLLSDKLVKRMRRAFETHGADFDKHVVLLPKLPLDEFRGLAAYGYAFLDTPVNSALVSVLDMLDYGPPPVTMPGRTHRSRNTLGLLNLLGVTETVARDVDQYVDIACRLAEDRDLRDRLSAQIVAGKQSLLRRTEPTRELEQFLIDAVNRLN